MVAGSAGAKVRSAARLVGEAAIRSGLWVTQRDDYPVTVKTGHSISEVVMAPQPQPPVGHRRPVADGIEDGPAADGEDKGMPAQMILLDLLEDGLDHVRFRLALLPAGNRQHRSAQLHEIPVHLGVPFDLAAEGGIIGQDSGIDEAQYFMAFSPPPQK